MEDYPVTTKISGNVFPIEEIVTLVLNKFKNNNKKNFSDGFL